MQRWKNSERERTRRLLGSAGLAVALHVLMFLLWLPILLPYLPHAAPGSSADPGDAGIASFVSGALQGAEITLQAPPALPGVPAPEPVVQLDGRTPVTPPESGPATPPAAAAAGGTHSTAPGPSTSGSLPGAGLANGGGAGDGDVSGAVPVEMALRPRVYVQPRVPEDIVRKRKIDDFVLLQVLVGTDGSVRDVRVLRAIANCNECTQSAVETARRYRYEPVTIDGRLVEMWTVPFSLRFSARR